MTQESDMQKMRNVAGNGRITWGEYSKMSGAPIPQGPAPVAPKSPQMDKQRRIAGNMGRVTASEYKQVAGKRGRRKIATGKASPSK